jgi:hypothetical protein
MRRQLAAAAVLFLMLPAVAPAQTKIPPVWLGTWQSGGMAPKSSPLGAPLPELPYAELDVKLGEFVRPWAFAEHEFLEWNIDDTGQVCKLDGTFRPGHGTGGTFRFVEGAGKLYQIWPATDERGLQRIYFDSPHPRNITATYGGDSRGRFEPDGTLVVDTIGFNDRAWLNSDRWAHTQELHIIERYRLFGGGKYLQIRVFVDDRKALKAPYTYTRYYTKMPEATEGGENICNQNLPEDDLWAIRRNKLLAEHEAQLKALVDKYANEPLPQRDPAPAPAPAAAPDRLKALAGVYQPYALTATVPGGLKASGSLADLALLPDAQKVAASRNLLLDPARHCITVGPFRMMARSDARVELLPGANRLTMMFENLSLGNRREVYLGRTQHSAKVEGTFLGDAIGRWEGDTLVIDSTGFNDMTWLNDAGAPHSTSLHLVERIRPLQGGRVLEYKVTADDPKALARPYTYTRYFERVNDELKEDFCETEPAAREAIIK